MAFYQPRANRTTQFPTVRISQQQGGGIQRGSAATSQVPQQSGIGSTAQGMLGLYSAGKMGSSGIDKAATLYDRYTMQSGVNSAGNVSPMYDATSANADFVGGGSEAAFPQGYQTAQAADSAAFMGEPTANSLAPTAIDATAYNSGNIGLLGGVADGSAAAGADAAATAATDAAATTALESAATTAATEGAGMAAAEGAATGAMGAEAGALGALGPIGLAAGIGLLGTKLFGLW